MTSLTSCVLFPITNLPFSLYPAKRLGHCWRLPNLWFFILPYWEKILTLHRSYIVAIKMNSIHDIADYIILRVKSEDKDASLINLKLQKLLYYVQAWSYGINKKPMFDGEFEAWVHGPVNREIYNRFNPAKYLYSEINVSDCLNRDASLSPDDAEFIDFILENYLKYSGAELERLSHNEMPWIKTRGDLNVNERCDKVITPELMMEYYGKKWETIKS